MNILKTNELIVHLKMVNFMSRKLHFNEKTLKEKNTRSKRLKVVTSVGNEHTLTLHAVFF